MQNSYDNPSNFETGDRDPFSPPKKQKKGVFARFKAFLFDKIEPTEQEKGAPHKKGAKADSDTIEKLNEFMGNIETQRDRVDVQNKSLLEQVSVLKTNNETLLKQITILTENNTRLTNQFNASKRREKIAKTLAIISSIAALGLTTYNILRMIIGW